MILRHNVINAVPAFSLITIDEKREEKPISHYLTANDIEQITDLPYVEQVHYSYTDVMRSSLLPFYIDEQVVNPENNNQFNIVGLNASVDIFFEKGGTNLIAGSMFSQTELENCSEIIIVHEQFAEKNNLRIGDFVQLTNIVYLGTGDKDGKETTPPIIYWQEESSFEVVGILKQTQDVHTLKNAPNMETNIANFEATENILYIPNTTLLQKITEKKEKYIELGNATSTPNFMQATVLLQNIEYQEQFEYDMNLILPTAYKLVSISDTIARVLGPFDTIAKIYQTLTIAIFIMGVLLVSGIILYQIRERRRELAIYMSCGEPARKTAFAVTSEYMLVILMAFLLSIVTVGLMQEMLATKIINGQLSNVQQTMASEIVNIAESQFAMNMETNIKSEFAMIEHDFMESNLSKMSISLMLLSNINYLLLTMYVKQIRVKDLLNK